MRALPRISQESLIFGAAPAGRSEATAVVKLFKRSFHCRFWQPWKPAKHLMPTGTCQVTRANRPTENRPTRKQGSIAQRLGQGCPKERWPKGWHGNFKDSVVKPVLALYGHPDKTERFSPSVPCCMAVSDFKNVLS